MQIRTEDLHRDRQQDDPEELADRDHPRGAEDALDQIHRLQNDKNKHQVQQDAQQDHARIIVSLQGHDRRQRP